MFLVFLTEIHIENNCDTYMVVNESFEEIHSISVFLNKSVSCPRDSLGEF